MQQVSDARFEQLINQAMDELPQHYITELDNVAITFADEPTEDQARRMKLRHGALLLGLFEGVPKTSPGAGSFPSRITLFKNSILQVVSSESQLFEQIKRTLWHEIAHYYGLDHDRMDYLMSK